MKWTKERPTQPGWYWWRRKEERRFDLKDINPDIVYTYEAVGGLFCMLTQDMRSEYGKLGNVEIIGGEWAGPIQEPEEVI